MANLARQAVGGLAKLVVALGALLFVPAWTLGYWQAWIYLAVFAASSAVITLYLWKRDPRLLERRVKAGAAAETRPHQKVIQVFATLAFIGTLVIPALDHRLGWSRVPIAAVIAGEALVAIGFAVVFVVFRENTFTAATIELAADQVVISSGPYAVVRHPMYAGALLLLLGTPLALGSWWGLLTLPAMTLTIVWRLLDEERFLAESLPGYRDYQSKVRHRLLPSIW